MALLQIAGCPSPFRYSVRRDISARRHFHQPGNEAFNFGGDAGVQCSARLRKRLHEHLGEISWVERKAVLEITNREGARRGLELEPKLAALEDGPVGLAQCRDQDLARQA